MNLTNTNTSIAEEIISGLSSKPKYISSKFFYDKKGSEIFQKIMRMPEYYPTNAEGEIFEIHKSSITKHFCDICEHIDLVELGAGDGIKTRILLKHMHENNINFRYIPVDISADANEKLANDLKNSFPGIRIEEKNGDYFEMIGELSSEYTNRKIVMFLGSNLGNYNIEESISFLSKLSSMMTKNDKLFMGLDLKKDPDVIRNAYDDPNGYTSSFNLNLLERFNRELGADFNMENFRHSAVYDPITGAAKSYLISTKKQRVRFKEINREVSFNKWEAIYTEMSQKYDTEMIQDLASASGFIVEENFYDSQNYFINTLWKKK
ncbi:MAG: L-histidine N(alpha)-methyltransferase [Bacteroidales bacterium]|jgi:L-histidine N-alpha-methyltransferase|nr:L-histidine N(alpha)-methyltransferase [Bacteroidales bacterium]